MKYETTSGYTKKAISASLKKQLQSKPFSKITVTDIINDCKLNRKTFYYHFTDMRDLLKWTLQQEAIDVVKNFDLLKDYEPAICFVMDYLEQNKHFIGCVYDAMGQSELRQFLYSDLAEIVKMIIEGVQKQYGKTLSKEFEQYLIMFYTEGLAGCMIDWLSSKTHPDRQITIRYITEIFKVSIPAFLEQAGK